MGYIVGLNALVFVLNLYDGTGQFINRLTLNPSLVMEGEVWRIITFLFIPPSASIIFIIFVLYFYFMIGTSLENRWGTFKFNLYYFLGTLGTIAAAFISGDSVNAVYLNLSLFLAFATLYPDYKILLFLIFPVKVKYLAYFNCIYYGYVLITAPLVGKIAVLMALVNYLIFFGSDIFRKISSKTRNLKRRREYKSKLNYGNNSETIHECTVCGLTEKDDPEMKFRYCTKCEGLHEYCSKHLNNHEHIE